MTQDRRITDKLPGHPLQWDDSASPSAAPAAGQAGLAKPSVLDLPSAIMNIPCKRTMSHFAKHDDLLHYKEGHRDARHAAADLVLERADELASLAAPVAADTEQATCELRKAVREMAAALEAREWAEHVSSDPDAAALEAQITELVGLHAAARKRIDEAISVATPADAGAGKALTNQRIIEIADQTRTAESRDGDYILPISFARAIEAEVLARLSTPGAPVAASDEMHPFELKRLHRVLELLGVAGLDELNGDRSMACLFALMGELIGRLEGQSPAPVTAEPVAELEELLSRLTYARTNEAPGGVEEAKAAIRAFVATHPAPARQAESLQTREAIRALKSMERAADAAETRDAKGGEHG